jgi:hypothetical protein
MENPLEEEIRFSKDKREVASIVVCTGWQNNLSIEFIYTGTRSN